MEIDPKLLVYDQGKWFFDHGNIAFTQHKMNQFEYEYIAGLKICQRGFNMVDSNDAELKKQFARYIQPHYIRLKEWKPDFKIVEFETFEQQLQINRILPRDFVQIKCTQKINFAYHRDLPLFEGAWGLQTHPSQAADSPFYGTLPPPGITWYRRMTRFGEWRWCEIDPATGWRFPNGRPELDPSVPLELTFSNGVTNNNTNDDNGNGNDDHNHNGNAEIQQPSFLRRVGSNCSII